MATIKNVRVLTKEEMDKINERITPIGRKFVINGGSIFENDGTIVATFAIEAHDVCLPNVMKIAKIVKEVTKADEVHHDGLKVA